MKLQLDQTNNEKSELLRSIDALEQKLSNLEETIAVKKFGHLLQANKVLRTGYS